LPPPVQADKQLSIPTGSKVIISIEPMKAIAEDQAWYALPSQDLQAVCDENEPDYSLDRIKVPNSEQS